VTISVEATVFIILPTLFVKLIVIAFLVIVDKGRNPFLESARGFRV
jgi:hypothetical protein